MFSIQDHQKLIEEMKKCTKCPLHQYRTQVVVGDYGNSPVCFIGEGPGYNEDIQGKPFVGRSGKLLDEMLTKINWSRKEVSVLNIVKCRPPENRAPTPKEMKICGDTWLRKQLDYLNPKLVVPLGSTSLKYFSPKSQITRDNSKPIQETDQFMIFPLFHPSYILRKGGDKDGKYFESFYKMKEMIAVEESEINNNSLENFFS